VWVIRAIRAKVMEAQMDQLGRVVAVSYAAHLCSICCLADACHSRSVQRVFSSHQWQSLSDRLVAWRRDLGDLLRVVREVRTSDRTFLPPPRAAAAASK
jgi:hypothetical protein